MISKEIRLLDKKYQEACLKLCNGFSFLGGKADCIHHFINKSQGYAIRWYIPNGIPLTIKQHNEIHQNKGKEYEDRIIMFKGQDWLKDLQEQRNAFAKYVSFKDVEDYLDFKTYNYV